jgi:hypothetical protein
MPKIETREEQAAATLARIGCQAKEDAQVLLAYIDQLVAFLLMDHPASSRLWDLEHLVKEFNTLPAMRLPADFTDPTDAQLERVLEHLKEMP